MEETNNTKPASQPDKGKKDKKEKKNGSFFAEHRAELRKVTWPNRQELAKETVTVIVVSLIVGVIIFAMDTILSFGYDKLIGLGGGSTNSVSTPVDTGLDLPEGVEIVTSDGTEGTDTDTVAEDADAEAVEAESADAEAGEAEAVETEAADTEAADTDASDETAEYAEADNSEAENAEDNADAEPEADEAADDAASEE